MQASQPNPRELFKTPPTCTERSAFQIPLRCQMKNLVDLSCHESLDDPRWRVWLRNVCAGGGSSLANSVLVLESCEGICSAVLDPFFVF